MRIRKFRKDDARKVSFLICKGLREVISKAYSQEVIQYLIPKNTPAKVLERSKKRDIYVAVEGDLILGTGSHRGDMLYNVFVDPGFHGKNIGRKLVLFLENKARQEGQKALRLSSSITAQEFYKKLGYEKVRIIRRKKGGDGILMKKNL